MIAAKMHLYKCKIKCKFWLEQEETVPLGTPLERTHTAPYGAVFLEISSLYGVGALCLRHARSLLFGIRVEVYVRNQAAPSCAEVGDVRWQPAATLVATNRCAKMCWKTGTPSCRRIPL